MQIHPFTLEEQHAQFEIFHRLACITHNRIWILKLCIMYHMSTLSCMLKKFTFMNFQLPLCFPIISSKVILFNKMLLAAGLFFSLPQGGVSNVATSSMRNAWVQVRTLNSWRQISIKHCDKLTCTVFQSFLLHCSMFIFLPSYPVLLTFHFHPSLWAHCLLLLFLPFAALLPAGKMYTDNAYCQVTH